MQIITKTELTKSKTMQIIRTINKHHKTMPYIMKLMVINMDMITGAIIHQVILYNTAVEVEEVIMNPTIMEVIEVVEAVVAEVAEVVEVVEVVEVE